MSCEINRAGTYKYLLYFIFALAQVYAGLLLCLRENFTSIIFCAKHALLTDKRRRAVRCLVLVPFPFFPILVRKIREGRIVKHRKLFFLSHCVCCFEVRTPLLLAFLPPLFCTPSGDSRSEVASV